MQRKNVLQALRNVHACPKGQCGGEACQINDAALADFIGAVFRIQMKTMSKDGGDMAIPYAVLATLLTLNESDQVVENDIGLIYQIIDRVQGGMIQINDREISIAFILTQFATPLMWIKQNKKESLDELFNDELDKLAASCVKMSAENRECAVQAKKKEIRDDIQGQLVSSDALNNEASARDQVRTLFSNSAKQKSDDALNNEASARDQVRTLFSNSAKQKSDSLDQVRTLFSNSAKQKSDSFHKRHKWKMRWGAIVGAAVAVTLVTAAVVAVSVLSLGIVPAIAGAVGLTAAVGAAVAVPVVIGSSIAGGALIGAGIGAGVGAVVGKGRDVKLMRAREVLAPQPQDGEGLAVAATTATTASATTASATTAPGEPDWPVDDRVERQKSTTAHAISAMRHSDAATRTASAFQPVDSDEEYDLFNAGAAGFVPDGPPTGDPLDGNGPPHLYSRR